MAEQWIDAATAVSLVTGGLHNLDARRSLCIRAHSGLLQTRARLLALTERQLVSRQEAVPVPQEFWWAEGDEALEQNWAAGDFATWIDGRVRVQAFGVTFALSGMLELLPPDKRALAAVRLSVAGNPAWVTAREARQFAYEKAGANPTTAGAVVLDRARLGFVTGRAVLAQRFEPSRYRDADYGDPPAWEEREWDIPTSFWREFTAPKTSHQDWERGLFQGAGIGPKRPCRMKLEGVHFLTESLRSLLPASEREAVQDPVPKAQGKGGGQPPRAFWDEMLCDIWALIHQGDFKPERQSDVEKAMLTWAELKGEKLSEATARPKARLLFERIKNEVTNFLAG